MAFQSQMSRTRRKAPSPRSRPQIAPPMLLHVTPTAPETVEQFLARGGVVERLDANARPRIASPSLREIGDATWKRAQAKKQVPRKR